MSKKKPLLALTLTLALSGCFNMPTPPSQITGSYTSELKFENYDCSRLAAEMDSLARRENQLMVAQEQRIKTSQVQAFWMGYGQGDGIEAAELANVRGEKEAVRKAIESGACRRSAATVAPTQLATPQQVARPAIAPEQQNDPARSAPYIYEMKRQSY